MKKLFLLSGLLSVSLWTMAQNTYQNHTQLSSRLKALSSKFSSSVTIQSIGKSKGNRDIWALTLGKGNTSTKPAIAIIAGVDGTHLAGTELAIQMAEKLASASGDSIAKLLDTKTFYFIPSVNPDAQEQFFAKTKFERGGNDTQTDDDRDGYLNEDPFEDLNGDGIITQIRVEDPTGTFIVSKEDPRVLIKADPAKGEKGKYLLLTEGTDNDKDGTFNEDGVGGVNIDKNMTYDYPIFTAGSGDFAASESETKALLSFLYKATNVFAVLTFGPANNLTEAPKFDRSKTAKRIITGILEKDATVGEQIAKLYNTQTGLKDAPVLPQTKGNLSQTAYFHVGRFSFTSPGWWTPKIQAPKDSTKKEVATPSKTSDNEDVKYLKWADAQKLTDVFVNWQSIKHPDFANKNVEVGGIAPYAKLNPPVSFLTESANKHVKFVTALAMQMPEIQIVDVNAEAVSTGLTRVTIKVINTGLLPTYAEIGDKVRWVQKVKTELKLTGNQAIVSGKKINLRSALGAGETQEYSWLISGNGSVNIEAGCPTTGVKTVNVSLK
ncbi:MULTISPECIES: M14 family metallopeptidase [unclassified Arcicella]|uniref:M14 family metallopeptidase n=1 Tax=unclassified Arcicella TaxID=2644986 RepID=UPI0028620190|nr:MULTISPECIES: M14 family metallopeptidase [unclassified Arcicella]MDR6562491.1 hypothetical protein [Arcicella sp. BE51]MDR6812578.1 hypothetical protein [Arcicella sp. BE140]MDR6823890.1 hypothetical protein [Arcicella sp. BE139]